MVASWEVAWRRTDRVSEVHFCLALLHHPPVGPFHYLHTHCHSYTIPVAVPVVIVTTVRVTSIGLTDLANTHTLALSQLSITVMAVSVNPTSTKQGGREGKYHDQEGAKIVAELKWIKEIL